MLYASHRLQALLQRNRHERHVRPSAFCRCRIGTAATAGRVRMFERRTAGWKAACDRPAGRRLDQGFPWLSSVLQKMLNWYLHVSDDATQMWPVSSCCEICVGLHQLTFSGRALGGCRYCARGKDMHVAKLTAAQLQSQCTALQQSSEPKLHTIRSRQTGRPEADGRLQDAVCLPYVTWVQLLLAGSLSRR